MAKQVNDRQRTLIRNSGKTLAIVGKFNPEEASLDSRTFVFSNRRTGEGIKGISAEALFSTMKPALALQFNETARIGDEIYNKYSIRTPLEADANSKLQVITSDSPLLSTDSEVFTEARVKLMQNHGSKLVMELTENLDKLASFTHSNFSRSLLKIARDYMYHATLEELGTFTQREWFNALESDYSLSSEIIKYLTSYERDEEGILTAVRAHLNNSEIGFSQEQQQALEDSLKRCKYVMKGGLQGDAIWEAIGRFQGNVDWLNNYTGHAKYGLPALSFVGGRDFLKYYQAFLTASEAVHRLVRSQTLHPYIFMWLSSKYASWDEGEFNKASDVMYDVGVEGQGDKRIPGVTFAERADMFERIRDAKIDDEIARQLIDDEMFQETFLAIAEDHTFNALLADKSVTAASLRYRAKKLFSRLSQLAGGTVGELLNELDEFNALFVPYYRQIKNTRPDEQEGYRIKDFEERLMSSIGERTKELFPNIESFLQEVLSNAQNVWEQNADAEIDLKTIITQEFVSAYGGVSKNHFARHYLENHDTIQAELEETERLYDIVRNQQQVSNETSSVGTPVVVTVETALPDARPKNLERFRQGIYEKQLEVSQGQSRRPIVKQGAKPESLEDVQGSFPVLNREGDEIATADLKDDNTYEITVQPENAEQLYEDDEAVLKVDVKGADSVEVLVAETDFPMEDVREVVEAQKQDEEATKSLLSDNAKLAQKQDAILGEYQKDDADPALSKGLRSLLLCEYILSVPRGESQLGKPDISNVLGLMVDIVEHLGDPNNPAYLEELMVRDGKASPELSRINLSKYYPVADSDQLWDVVNYQYQLASEITRVQGYLQELSEIRGFMDAMAPANVDVIFVNSTLDDQASAHPSQLVFNREDGPPSVVYLTAQAEVSSSSLQNLARTFAQYAGKDIMSNFQMPVFISPQAFPPGLVEGAAVPLYGANELGLEFGLYGSGEELTIPDVGIVTDKFIQRSPYLLLAASVLMPAGSQNFGQIRQIARKTFDDIHGNFRLETRQQQSLADLLREVWTKSTKPLLDALIFNRWFNQLLLCMQDDEEIELVGRQVAVDIAEAQDAFAEPLVGLPNDLRVLVKSDREGFNRPENLKNAVVDLTLNAPFAAGHRGKTPSTLQVPFKGPFLDILLEVNSPSEPGAEEPVQE